MQATRYLLVKGFSGLGNRLQALAEAIIYARLSGRELLIDWNDSLYSSDGNDVFHRLFGAAAGRNDQRRSACRIRRSSDLVRPTRAALRRHDRRASVAFWNRGENVALDRS